MGYIYKIINDVNNKIYIGQTINSIEYRFKNHIKESIANTNNKFHQAIYNIGPEHFKIELIEKCPDHELNDKEKYWIKFYDSVNNGYNTTFGGSCGLHYNRDEILNLWNQGLIIQDISQKIGIDRGLLGSILKTLGISEEEINKRRYIANRRQIKNKSVYQINPQTGEIIKCWERISDIERELKINHSLIIGCCKLKPQNKTAGGFAWRYIDDYNPNTDKEKLIQYTVHENFKNTKHVLKYSSTHQLLEEYSSTQAAAKSVNKNSRNIARYCRGERQDPNGFIWKYKKGE